MALKNWKKIEKDEWKKKEWKPYNWTILWIGYFKDGFKVVKSSSVNRIVLKSFKTKSAALKFAKQYMRTH